VTVPSVEPLPGRTQVLVAGGGPVGLATAVELGQRGIRCLVVEPRAEVSHARPRCKTVNVRTMEHLRRWGLAGQLRDAAPLPVSWSQDVVFCTSLVGRELSRFHGVLGLAAEGDRFPELGQQAPQYLLEELLRQAAGELPACTLAAGLRVVSLEQDDAAVKVRIGDRSGQSAIVTADYVVGCDGPRSTVRDQISVHYLGEHALRPNFGMVFTAPQLAGLVRHGPAVHYWIVNDVAPALMGPLDLAGTWWIIAFGVDEEDGRRDPHRLIDGAAGAPVEATILSTDPWTARMQLAGRLRAGRVFLAGDAAHLNPPFGGHGLNTGIGDAVDLGWKLAAVLQGWGGERLLDSYEAERRPIQDRVIGEATRNMTVLTPELLTADLDEDGQRGRDARAAAHRRIQETKHAEFFALDLVLDVTLDDSPVIAPAPGNTDAALRPGARLGHAWLAPGWSLFDELGPGLSLLLLSAADPADLVQAARRRGAPLKVIDLTGTTLGARYGADAALVRPDQYVAWCGRLHGLDAAALTDRVCGGTRSTTTPRPLPADRPTD
jgi:2-polyprenyl-6-methoxyphenol hydroxylase-like FAD-dependent oxidoreductase